MPASRKKQPHAAKIAKAKDLRATKVSERDAARIKGGRRDKIATNHNQTLRFH